MKKNNAAQLDMFATFEKAAFEEATAHLPSTMDEAAPYFMSLLIKHHAAIVAGGEEAYSQMEEECEQLAVRLNGGTRMGIKAGKDAPCDQLADRTQLGHIDAPPGKVPLWGQQGEFTIEVRGIAIRIEWEGVFGICSPSFGAHAVDRSKPFVSSTGYRSFLGDMSTSRGCGGFTPQEYAAARIERHIDSAEGLKGKLEWIDKEHGGPGAPASSPRARATKKNR